MVPDVSAPFTQETRWRGGGGSGYFHLEPAPEPPIDMDMPNMNPKSYQLPLLWT